MKRMLLAAGGALLLATFAWAADPNRSNDVAVRADAAKEGPANLNTADPKIRGRGMRASKVIGMVVYDEQGKKLGSVNDLVLNTEKGSIQYAALSFGGFLGVGDKLFAIPWSSFRYTTNRDGEYALFLDVPEATLKSAPGFDQNAWPDFANEELTGAIDRHYDTRRESNARRP